MYCPKTYANFDSLNFVSIPDPCCLSYFASYASQVSPLFTHNQGVQDLDIFISGVIFGMARPSIILNALSPPLTLCCLYFHCAIRRRLIRKCFYEVSMKFLGRLCCLYFHCAIRRRLIRKCFHEVSMKFLGRLSFLTEVFGNCSDFKFLHFANLSHPPLLKVLYITNPA